MVSPLPLLIAALLILYPAASVGFKFNDTFIAENGIINGFSGAFQARNGGDRLVFRNVTILSTFVAGPLCTSSSWHDAPRAILIDGCRFEGATAYFQLAGVTGGCRFHLDIVNSRFTSSAIVITDAVLHSGSTIRLSGVQSDGGLLPNGPLPYPISAIGTKKFRVGVYFNSLALNRSSVAVEGSTLSISTSNDPKRVTSALYVDGQATVAHRSKLTLEASDMSVVTSSSFEQIARGVEIRVSLVVTNNSEVLIAGTTIRTGCYSATGASDVTGEVLAIGSLAVSLNSEVRIFNTSLLGSGRFCDFWAVFVTGDVTVVSSSVLEISGSTIVSNTTGGSDRWTILSYGVTFGARTIIMTGSQVVWRDTSIIAFTDDASRPANDQCTDVVFGGQVSVQSNSILLWKRLTLTSTGIQSSGVAVIMKNTVSVAANSSIVIVDTSMVTNGKSTLNSAALVSSGALTLDSTSNSTLVIANSSFFRSAPDTVSTTILRSTTRTGRAVVVQCNRLQGYQLQSAATHAAAIPPSVDVAIAPCDMCSIITDCFVPNARNVSTTLLPDGSRMCTCECIRPTADPRCSPTAGVLPFFAHSPTHPPSSSTSASLSSSASREPTTSRTPSVTHSRQTQTATHRATKSGSPSATGSRTGSLQRPPTLTAPVGPPSLPTLPPPRTDPTTAVPTVPVTSSQVPMSMPMAAPTQTAEPSLSPTAAPTAPPPQTPKPVPPTPPTVAAVQSTTAGVTAVAAMANPAVAAQSARSSLVLTLASCAFDLENELDWTASPTQLTLTSDVTKRYSGAVVANTALVIGAVAFHGAIAKAYGTISGKPQAEALAKMRFPSSSVMLLTMILLQPTVAAAVTVLRHSTRLVPTICAGCFLAGLVSSVVACATFLRRHFHSTYDIPPPKRRPKGCSRFMDGDGGKWVDTDTDDHSGWTKSWGHFFKDYRGGNAAHFTVAEVLMSIGCGVLDGWKSDDQATCTRLVYSLVALNAVYFMYLTYRRPHPTPFDLVAFFLISGLQLASAVAALFASGNTLAESVSERGAIGSMIVATVKGVLDLLRQALRLLQRCAAKGDEEHIGKADDDNDTTDSPNNNKAHALCVPMLAIPSPARSLSPHVVASPSNPLTSPPSFPSSAASLIPSPISSPQLKAKKSSVRIISHAPPQQVVWGA